MADVILAEESRLPADLAAHIDTLVKASRARRRDRELAFSGAENLTPSTFYREGDAVLARDQARAVVALVRPHVTAGPA